MACVRSWLFAVLVALAACSTSAAEAPKTVYLACELVQDGVVISRPQLLADVGVPVKVHQRGPAGYALELKVLPHGDQFQVSMDVTTVTGRGRLSALLRHNTWEEKPVDGIDGLSMRMLLLRVPSPELDERLRRPSGRSSPLSI